MNSNRRRPKPAITEESREGQLVSQAIDLAEQQIREGTASSQVITHFLKLGSTREKLEQERLRRENELLRSKVEAMASAKRVEELYAEALKAMRTYAGQEDTTDAEFDDYDD
jgi:acyl-CoA thioesterase